MPAESLATLGKSVGLLALALALFGGGYITGVYTPSASKEVTAVSTKGDAVATATSTATSTVQAAVSTTTKKVAVKTATPAAPKTAPVVAQTFTGTSGAWQGAIISGLYSPFLEFVRSDFDRAVHEGKLAVLFFYEEGEGDAIELIRITNAFAKRTAGGVVGFKIDFGAKADAAEKELAAYYSVEKTNTKVLVRNGIILVKTADVWNEARIAKELEEQW